MSFLFRFAMRNGTQAVPYNNFTNYDAIICKSEKNIHTKTSRLRRFPAAYPDLEIVVYISNANVGRGHAPADHGSIMYTNIPAIDALCVIFRPQKLQRGRRGHDPALHLRCIMNCDYHGSIPSGAQWRMDHRLHSARIVGGDSPLNYNLFQTSG